VGDVNPFIFKVAIFIEAIRSNAEGVGKFGGQAMVIIRCPLRVVTLVFCSSVLLLLSSCCTSVPFSSIIFLVRFGPLPGWFVVDSSSGGVVASPAGTASSVSSPSALPQVAAVSCLAPSCVFAYRGHIFSPVGSSSAANIYASTAPLGRRHFRLNRRLAVSSSRDFGTCRLG
jgi:hypothetical protein